MHDKFQQYTEEIYSLFPVDDITLIVLGLCSESGELADLVKKNKLYGKEVSTEEYKKELADVVWHFGQNLRVMGFDLEDITDTSLEKTQDKINSGLTKCSTSKS